MTELEKAREFFRNDRFATENGMYIVGIGEHYAKIGLKIQSRHLNAVGALMGGVYPTIADFACAVAACRTGEPFVTADCRVSCINAFHGTEIFAETKCVKYGRNLAFFNVEITEDTGRLLATAQFTMFRAVRN